MEFNILINTYKSKKLSLVRYALKALKDILGYHESPVDRQYLLDIAAYIFNYAPEYFSTQNLYTLFLKHRKLHEGIEKEENILLIVMKKYLIEFTRLLNNILMISILSMNY